MGYRIQYEPEMAKKYPMRIKKKRTSLALTLLLGAVLLGGALLKDQLKQWLLPGDAAVTEAAFTEMVESLRSGDSFKYAVTAFCTEILENG